MQKEEKVIPYIQSPKFLRRMFDPNVIVYFELLLDAHSYWTQNTEQFKSQTGHDYDGWSFYARSEITKRIRIKKGAQMNAEKLLKKEGLIYVHEDPYNANWYMVDFDRLDEMYKEYEASKPNKDSRVSYPDFTNHKTNKQQQLDAPPADDQMPPQPIDGCLPVQQSDANKNEDLKMKYKNKVSKDTYVSNETDAKSNTSCINKKEPAQMPSGADAQFGKDMEEATEIINKYNNAMGLTLNSKDQEYSHVFTHLEDLKSMKQYFTPNILNKVWTDYGDDYTRSLDSPRISGFIKSKLLEQMIKHIKVLTVMDTMKVDNLLDKVFRQYEHKIEGAINDMGFSYNYGNLEPYDASIHFPTKKQREVRLEIYNKHIKPLLSDDIKHDMMILEV